MLYFEQANAEAWLAAVDGNRAVVVDLASRPGDVPALWLSLHAESGVRGVLDHLTAKGLSAAPGFILLEWDGDWATGAAVRAIVRGAASVTLRTKSGPTTISGAQVSTWTEQHLEGVSSFELAVGGAPGRGGIALPLGVGAAWTSRLSSAYFEVERDAVAEPLAVAETQAPAKAPLPPVSPVPVVSPVPPVQQVPPAPPVAPDGSFSEQTIMEMPGDELADPSVDSSSSAESAFDAIDDATVIGRGGAAARASSTTPVAAAAPAAAATAAAPASDAGDHDGFTVMSGDLRKLRKQRAAQGSPVAEAPPPAPSPVATVAPPRPTLRLPSGEIVGLDEPVLIGRAPSVSKVSGAAVPRLVSLGGVDQDISRNHVQVTVEGDTVVVTDLHSRNGTLIVLPGKSPQKLRSGEPTAVIVGTLIDLGSGIGIIVGEA